MRARAIGVAAVWAALTSVAGCTPHRFAPPAGPGEPAPDARAAWNEATAACRQVGTYQAQMHVSGQVGTQHLSRTLNGAVTLADHIRLELPAPIGRPGFTLAGEGRQSTLLLRDKRQVTAPARDIVEALTGLKWGPQQLLLVLDGCAAPTDPIAPGTRIGTFIVVTAGTARVYLERRNSSWEIRAILEDGLTIEYRATADHRPIEIRIDSDPGRSPSIGLSLSLTQIVVNAVMQPAAFVVKLPADAVPMTLDELRAMGPLGAGGHE